MPIQYDVCYDSEATEKKQCTLASSGYYLAGDVATVCATVAGSSARTCNAAAGHDIEYCNLLYCNTYNDLKNALCGGAVCTTLTHACSCYAHWESSGKTESRLPDPDECMKRAGIQTVTCNTGFVSFVIVVTFYIARFIFIVERILF